jgi:hypothetical protein
MTKPNLVCFSFRKFSIKSASLPKSESRREAYEKFSHTSISGVEFATILEPIRGECPLNRIP